MYLANIWIATFVPKYLLYPLRELMGVFLEHVEVVVTFEHSLRRALEVTLMSARGNWEPLYSISLPTTERPSKHLEVVKNCSQFICFPYMYLYLFINFQQHYISRNCENKGISPTTSNIIEKMPLVLTTLLK